MSSQIRLRRFVWKILLMLPISLKIRENFKTVLGLEEIAKIVS